MRIPGEYWETQACNAFPVIEQLFAKEDGSLIGASSDGFIFSAYPNLGRLVNWGKLTTINKEIVHAGAKKAGL